MNLRHHELHLRVAITFVLLIASNLWGQLRIVSYNTAGGPRSGMDEILRAIGDEENNGIRKPIDVLSLQEQGSVTTTTQSILNTLNGIYGAGVYARSTLDGGTTGAGRPTLIYNTQTVQLISESTASTLSGSGAARQTLRFHLRPVGYDAAADFYVYGSHYKASDSSADAARRNVEALQIRANADGLGNAHIIYTGDLNIYRSSEPMWTTLTGSGNGQAFDPVNRVGNWHDSSGFRDVHTQNPAGSGFVGGGMDDRFDWQLVSGEMLDGNGLSYIPGTYHAFGNTNTHTLNGAINSGSVSTLQARLPGYSTSQVQTVLNALAAESDHLPVVSDYQLPAKLFASVDPVPARVMRGAALQVDVTVANNASVVAAHGADELVYTVTGGGAVSGTHIGTDMALGGQNQHTLLVNTSAAGLVAGDVNISSSSEAVANNHFGHLVETTVLDHANPSFSTTVDLNSLTIDFGVVPEGTDDTRSLLLANLESTFGFTSSLDLDVIAGTGDTAVLTIDLAATTGILAGQSIPFSADLQGTAAGSYTATYLLSLSDENLLGADGCTMSLVLNATVAPEPGSACVLAGILGIIALRRSHPHTKRRPALSSPLGCKAGE